MNFYLGKFEALIKARLGMERPDIENEMREQIWKGLSSFNKRKPASLKTYLTNIIGNRFKTLAKKAIAKKNGFVDHYDDPYSQIPEDEIPSYVIDDVVCFRENILDFVSQCKDEEEASVIIGLYNGRGLDEFQNSTKLSRDQIVSLIKRADAWSRQRGKSKR